MLVLSVWHIRGGVFDRGPGTLARGFGELSGRGSGCDRGPVGDRRLVEVAVVLT